VSEAVPMSILLRFATEMVARASGSLHPIRFAVDGILCGDGFPAMRLATRI
jgi:hypothetical protein